MVVFALICPILALIFLTSSLIYAWNRMHITGLIAAVLELLSSVILSLAWARSLKAGGNDDWFLLGLFGYPVAAFLLFSMFAAGALCIALHIRGIWKRRQEQAGI